MSARNNGETATTETLLARKPGVPPVRFRLDVFVEGEHWTRTLARLDERGASAGADVAPRFYGFTRDQARRRMIAVLENEYDEVTAVP